MNLVLRILEMRNVMSAFQLEVKKGQRFEFGKNWQAFLDTLTEERIRIAEKSIVEMIKMDDLKEKRVLDIGSGSGLFSLAARKLGAKVYSFDYDPESVACTQQLRLRYMPNDQNWIIQEGSVLDKNFLKSLGSFDIVYSWGVLHHTGNMWTALENAASLVGENGILFIAIYNDEGLLSKFWKKVKEFYCSSWVGKTIVVAFFIPYFFLRSLYCSIVQRKNVFSEYKKNRGMSIFHDWYDWLGGLPFEVATVEEISRFLQRSGFILKNVRPTRGLGNNQFVFLRKLF